MTSEADEAAYREEQLARRLHQKALDVLAETGVRLMTIAGALVVGIWSDQDSARVRRALAALGHDRPPVRYLDGGDVPMRYKVRRVPGEPVPASVLEGMREAQRTKAQRPWELRDRLLEEMQYLPEPRPFAVDMAGLALPLSRVVSSSEKSEEEAPSPDGASNAGGDRAGLFTEGTEKRDIPTNASLTAVSPKGMRVFLIHPRHRDCYDGCLKGKWLIYTEVETTSGETRRMRRKDFQTISQDHAKRVAHLWYGIEPDGWEREEAEAPPGGEV